MIVSLSNTHMLYSFLKSGWLGKFSVAFSIFECVGEWSWFWVYTQRCSVVTPGIMLQGHTQKNSGEPCGSRNLNPGFLHAKYELQFYESFPWSLITIDTSHNRKRSFFVNPIAICTLYYSNDPLYFRELSFCCRLKLYPVFFPFPCT